MCKMGLFRLCIFIAATATLTLFMACDSASDDDDDSSDDDSDDDGGPVECPNGAIDCPWDQGCPESGICGQCEKPGDCRNMEGCLSDGSCGPCTDSTQCPDGEYCTSGFCMSETLHDYQVAVTQENWDAMMDDPQAEIEVPCTVVVDGTDYGGATLSLLGVTSRNAPKKTFRIEFPEDADHPGYSRKINLRADYSDQSGMRSFLSYEVFRRLTDVPTPRARFVRLSFNGTYYGLMTESERIGGAFLDRYGKSRDNSEYEVETGNPLGAFVPSESLAEYQTYWQKKTGDEEDFTDLISFIEDNIWLDYLDSGTSGPTSTARVSSMVDIAEYLDFLAVYVLLDEVDHVVSNFAFSWQEGDEGNMRWEFYPYDLNATLGCLFSFEDWDTDCTARKVNGWWMNGVIPDGFMAVEDGNAWINVLTHLVLKNTDNYATYTTRICEMFASDFWNTRLPKLVEAVSDTIWDAMEEDTNDINDTMDGFVSAKEDLQYFFTARKEYMVSQLACP